MSASKQAIGGIKEKEQGSILIFFFMFQASAGGADQARRHCRGVPDLHQEGIRMVFAPPISIRS